MGNSTREMEKRQKIRYTVHTMFSIPKDVSRITETLEAHGFEAYLVGGCVRDLVRGKKPKDWDVATNAIPSEIQGLFVDSFYENDFGTVGVVNKDVSDETLKVVEVTPFRIEGKYTDNRRPDEVHFSKNIEDDLKRRDLTINAIAYSVSKGHTIDLYKGHQDIKDKVIRAVGDANDRFSEDALRVLRAVRLATELGFTIEEGTKEAVHAHAKDLDNISRERIRDEFSKIIMSERPMEGMILARETGVLSRVLPELEKGWEVEQNGDHIYSVWEHNLRAVQHSADRGWDLHVRLAALLHDVAKPETRRWSAEKNNWTFYGHDVVGGRVARKALERLRFSKHMVDVVSTLVRHHLFFSDVDQITLSAVRRMVRNVGPENIWDLMKVRACDRIGMGRPKETPYRLRKYEAMIEEAMRAPVSVQMLKIDGAGIMETTGERPGPKIGMILHALLEEVLDNPEKNTDEYMRTRAKELANMPMSELGELGQKGKEKKEEKEEKEISEIRKKHWVK